MSLGEEDFEQIRKMVLRLFKAFDRNRDGYLDIYQFGEFIQQISNTINQSRPSPTSLDQLLDFIDCNKDGLISIEEFQLIAQLFAKIITQKIVSSAKPEAERMILSLHNKIYS